MDTPSARASAMSCLCSTGVSLSVVGLLRLSFTFFRGLPIFLLISVVYLMYANKSNTILGFFKVFFLSLSCRLSLPFQPLFQAAHRIEYHLAKPKMGHNTPVSPFPERSLRDADGLGRLAQSHGQTRCFRVRPCR